MSATYNSYIDGDVFVENSIFYSYKFLIKKLKTKFVHMHKEIIMKCLFVSLLIALSSLISGQSIAVHLECKSFEVSSALILDQNMGSCARVPKPYHYPKDILYYRYFGLGPIIEADFLSRSSLFCLGSRVEHLYGQTFYGGKAGLSFILGVSGAGFMNNQGRTCAIIEGHGITFGGGATAGKIKFYKTIGELMND